MPGGCLRLAGIWARCGLTNISDAGTGEWAQAALYNSSKRPVEIRGRMVGLAHGTRMKRVGAGLLVLLLSGCGVVNLRPVECDPGERVPEPRLDCHESVALATTALRQPHAAITRTQFLFGSRSPQIGGILGFNGGETAYVVFTFADGTHQSLQLFLTGDGPMLEGSFRSG